MLGTDSPPSPQGTSARLQGQALAAVVTDDRGLVCAVSPQLAELGLDVSPERIGRHWTELLPSFRRLPMFPGSGEDDFVVVIEADRSAFRMTRLSAATRATRERSCWCAASSSMPTGWTSLPATWPC